MTASEKVAVKSAQKASFGKVFAVQIAAYVVLVVLALIPGISYGNAEEPAIVSFTVVASVAMIALLAVFNRSRWCCGACDFRDCGLAFRGVCHDDDARTCDFPCRFG